jgi:hypothetical protein
VISDSPQKHTKKRPRRNFSAINKIDAELFYLSRFVCDIKIRNPLKMVLLLAICGRDI